MKDAALTKAFRALSNVADGIHRIEVADNAHDFGAGWYVFLVASENVFHSLRPAKDQVGEERKWYGTWQTQRKNDPLLIYIHQARNTEEHTHGSTFTYLPKKFGMVFPNDKMVWPGPGHSVEVFGRVQIKGNETVGIVDKIVSSFPIDESSPLQWMPARVWLEPALDSRFNNSFPPPEEHLGKKIEDGSPVAIANLTFSFLKSKVEEARRLFGNGLHISF